MSSLRRRNIPSAKKPSVRFSSRDVVASKSGLAGVRVSSEEADAILQELANHDDDAKKTWSRIFVEQFLSKYNWYWPGRNNPRGPQLKKAWAYYEHVTLPRKLVGEGAADTVMRRAEPGEHETDTELYDPFFTFSQKTLVEWGTGVDLYFMSLRFFAVLMLVAGLINIPSIKYYATGDYNGGKARDVSLLMKGSAVCTNTEWVVCTDCKADDWDRDKERYAIGLDPDGTEVVLTLRNFCRGADTINGVTNFVTLLLVIVSVSIFSYYLRLREVRYDEDKVTTTDYSVVVRNPPEEALDPDKWRDFFSQFATDGDQVTVVTVALNNRALVKKLLTRRIFCNQLRSKLPVGTDLDDEVALRVAVDQFNQEKSEQEVGCIGKILARIVTPILNSINMLLAPDDLVEKINTLTEEIKDLQNEKYGATEVYITFETEEGQRTALDALTVGQIDLLMNRTHSVPPECLFEGKILQVEQPTEPNAVRWLDLSYSFIEKAVRRLIALSFTLGMIVFASLIISKARSRAGAWLAGPLTTVFNSTIPQIIKILMMIEPHSTEGGYQASMYLKITLFRWTLSAILIKVITPTTSTLGSSNTDLLPGIYAILLSDVWLSPLLRLSDWMSNLKKHVLAPRARTQEEMNLSFQGTFYNMGERYTDFTKVLFVVFFYSALFPAGFFFGFLILSFQYWVDRYSLLRIWGWAPLFGSELAVFSRRFFFNGALIAFAVVSSFIWAQFPYDNVCDPKEGESQAVLSGNYTIVTSDGVKLDTVKVDQETNVVFCDQSAWSGYVGFAFPATPRIQTDDPSWLAKVDSNDLTWMTDSQENLTFVYGWFSVAVVLSFTAALFGRGIYDAIVSIFMGNYQPQGDSQHIDFSSNPMIFAYVPQFKLVGQPFPFICCNIDEIDQGMIGWNDAAHGYDHYNLIFEVPHKSLLRTKTIDGNTRGTDTIAEQDEYETSQTRFEVNRASQTGFEVNEASAGVRPIYSQIKHYPTKWQLELAEKEALEG